MKTILIIEDETAIREHLASEAKKANSKIIVKLADSKKDAIDIAMKNDIDAFFIDIHLVDSNGIDLAKHLRKVPKYQFVPMVFITGAPNMELETFRQTHCYDYILKPFTDEQLKEVFSGILGNYFSMLETKEKVVLDFGYCTRLVDADDIVYVEYSDRKIRLITTSGHIDYKHISLKKFMQTVSKHFLQIHQAYAVNMRHVNYYSMAKGIVNVDYSDIDIPVGRTYKKTASETLNSIGITLNQ